MDENLLKYKKFLSEFEIAKFTPQQVRSYEDSLKYYRDLKNSLDTAREEGLVEGIEKGRIEGKEKGILLVAENLIKARISSEIISQSTGLSVEEIEKLKDGLF